MSHADKRIHTPGPWHLRDRANAGGFAIKSNYRGHDKDGHLSAVANCKFYPWTPEAKAEAEANARLIVAAPELLAEQRENLKTLENLLAYIRKHEARLPPVSLTSLEVRIEKTRGAVAKASA